MGVKGRSFSRQFGCVVALLLTTACGSSATRQQPRAEYDAASGHLRRLTFDLRGNGHYDAVSIMDGTRIDRIELDLDQNGKTDRWDFYDGGSSLRKVGLSRRNDGVMDAQAFFDGSGGLARIEISTRRDGAFNRTEYYDRGVLVRSIEHHAADGHPDTWATYRPNPGARNGEPPYAIESFGVVGSGAATASSGSSGPTR
jgi:hypothetical protein